MCSGAVEICIGDDKDSKNSADKAQRARTEDYEGPLMGSVAAGSRQGKGRTRKRVCGCSKGFRHQQAQQGLDEHLLDLRPLVDVLAYGR